MNDSTGTLRTDPRTDPSRSAPSEAGRLYGLMAEFDTPAAIYHAAETVRDAGFRWWDCMTPFPVHGLDRAMGVRPTILPILVFIAGASGAIGG